MALTERLALLVSLDADGAIRGLEGVGKAVDKNLGKVDSTLDVTAQKFKKAGVGMVATAGLIGTGLYKAGQAAGELEQAVGGTEAVFKGASGYIEKFAKDAARNMGLSESAFRTATTSIGGQLKGVGFSMDEAAERSVELTGIAADLAATYGGTTAEAVAALGSAFRGEADPAERFNLRLNQNAVNAKAVEMGLAATTSEVDANAKAQATLALILEQSADAQGGFARETDTAAGAMAIANAEFENAKASLGQAVAPIMADVASAAADLAGGFTSANEATGGLLSQLAAFGTIGLGATGGLLFAAGKAIEMRDTFKSMSPLVKGLAGTAGLAGLGIAIGMAGDAAQEARTSIEALSKMTDQELTDAFRNAQAGLEMMGKDGLEPFTRLAEDNLAVAVRVRDAMADQGEEVGDLDAILKEAGSTQKEVNTSQAEAAEKAEELTGATKGLTEEIDGQAEALGRLLEATIAQFNTDLAYRQSVDDVQDSLAELAATQKEHGTNSEEYRDQLLSTEGSLLSQADAAVRLAEDQAKAAGQTLSNKQSTEVYRNELVRLRDSLAPGSPLRAALDGYIGRLDAVPRNVQTTLHLNAEAALVAASNATRRILSLGGLFGGGRASGGPVSAGQTYLVGERGPELVTMGSSGYVTPNHELGGVGTIVIPVSIGGHELERVVVDTTSRAVRRGYAL